MIIEYEAEPEVTKNLKIEGAFLEVFILKSKINIFVFLRQQIDFNIAVATG